MKSRSCGLVRRVGAVDYATPLPDPSGGAVECRHTRGPVTSSRIGVRDRFRTNRSCRRGPARQGVKSRSCGLVRRVGAVDSAAPLPDPSRGQAPALHSPRPAPPGFRQGAGTPRCEKPKLWFVTAGWRGGLCRAPPRPQRGTSPSTTFPSPRPPGFRQGPARQGVKSRSCYLVRRVGVGGFCHAPPRPQRGTSPSTTFPSPRPPGFRQGPARQGVKSRSCGLVRRVGAVDYAAPLPDPSGGQAPALHSPRPALLDSGRGRHAKV